MKRSQKPKRPSKPKTAKDISSRPPDSESSSQLSAKLVEAFINGDVQQFRQIGNDLAGILYAQGSVQEAKRIRAALKKRRLPIEASNFSTGLPLDSRTRLPLLEERPWPGVPVFVDEVVSEVFSHLVEDAQHSEHLSQKGLSSSLCMLLSGPPGTGKTLLAGHVASQLKRPLFVARLDGVISSLLGETAKNIRAIFEFVAHKECVLLLDEIDAIAKVRDDKHEVGEIKRVVNTLIQGLDFLDHHTVVVGATNHPHLLDTAIWRRFPYLAEVDFPREDARKAMWSYFLFDEENSSPISDSLAKVSDGLSGADIREVSLRCRRRALASNSPLEFEPVASAIMSWGTSSNAWLGSSADSNSESRTELARFLCLKHKLSKVDAATILGVTRQTISNYLKENDHG